MPSDQEMGVLFPTAGLDVTCEFGRQPFGTAAAGSNVRSYDPILSRARGGSRPGLSKLLADRVNGLAAVQHLSVLVDPQAEALNADSDNQLPGYILDPSTSNTFDRGSGRYVPPGGGLKQPNKNIPSSGSGSGIQLVQCKDGSFSSSGPQTAMFDSPVTVGNLVVAVLTVGVSVTLVNPPGVVPGAGDWPASLHPNTVRDLGLVDMPNVGGAGYYSDFRIAPSQPAIGGTFWYLASLSVGMFYAVAAGDNNGVVVDIPAQPPEVPPRFTNGVGFQYKLMEFSQTRAAGPLDQFSKWSAYDQDFTSDLSVEAGPVSVGAVGGLAVSAFSGSPFSFPPITPTTGFTIAGGTFNGITAGYKSGFSAPAAVVFAVTVPGGVAPSGSSGMGGVSATFFKRA